MEWINAIPEKWFKLITTIAIRTTHLNLLLRSSTFFHKNLWILTIFYSLSLYYNSKSHSFLETKDKIINFLIEKVENVKNWKCYFWSVMIEVNSKTEIWFIHHILCLSSRAAVIQFRAGSTFPVPVCTVSPGHWVNKADTQ